MPHVTTEQDCPVLIIAGMHRSGTSLTAELLQRAGLHLGERLLGAHNSNLRGHFENLDFLEFHRQVLRSQGLHPNGWVLQESVAVDGFAFATAKELIKQNRVDSPWGWKDPRTALFLDFWAALLPESKFLFVFRAPWLVVDSLYRRGDDVFQADPKLAAKTWIFYNQAILNFLQRHGDRCFLTSIKAVIEQPEAFLDALCTRFQIPLKIPESFPYEPSLFHYHILDEYYPLLAHQPFPEALSVYQQLLDFQEPAIQGSAGKESLFEIQQLIERSPLQASEHKPLSLLDWATKTHVRHQLGQACEQVQAGNIDKAIAQVKHALQRLNSFNAHHYSQQPIMNSTNCAQPPSPEAIHTEPTPRLATVTNNPALQKMQVELDTLRQQVKQFQEERTELQTKFQSAEEGSDRLQKQVRQAQRALEETQFQLQDSQKRVQQLQIQKQQLESDLHQSQMDYQQTQMTLAECQALLKQTQDGLAQSQLNYQQAHDDWAACQVLLTQTQDGLTQSQEQLHETETMLAECHSQLTRMQEERDATQSAYQQFQKETAQLQTQLQAQLQEVHTELEQVMGECKHLRSRLDAVQDERNYFDRMSQAWMQTAHQLETEYREKTRRLETESQAWMIAAQKVAAS
ncbi:MAG: sulfotransferase [Synechococcales bacterium]|nr:sulfotransferase [Synechococcales bacterium]